MKTYSTLSALLLISFLSIQSFAQETGSTQESLESLQAHNENLRHRIDVLEKKIDDVIWAHNMSDWAYVDKHYIYGPPKWKDEDVTGMSYGNPLKFWTYVFIPKNVNTNEKYPLIVFPHGGVHGDMSTYYTHIIRELVSQGYVVVAPEYRGSTGYGKGHYQNIDYGGLENEDVYASRNHAIETYSFIDKDRVGIMGWSHGGMITLMNIFNHPEDYQVAYAGVPVSDIISRMGYMDDDYRALYSADYHIGKTAGENIAEYRRRSPAWNTHKFQNTPLLIYTNTSDDDVNVLEVEHLIKSLKADGKKFEYKIFDRAPGGHSFDRLDTKGAKEIRIAIYKHMAKYLNPKNPIQDMGDIQKAGYRF